jgi:hypothetical protein
MEERADVDWTGSSDVRTSGSQVGSTRSSDFEGAARHVSPTARAFSPNRQGWTAAFDGKELRLWSAERGRTAVRRRLRLEREQRDDEMETRTDNIRRGSAPETVNGHAVGTKL